MPSFVKLLALLSASTYTAASGVLFPMYIYPFFNTPCGGWAGIADTVKAHPKIPFYLVINPDSGPGPLNTQPNSDWTGCIPQLKAAGSNVHVIGYVHVNYGSQSQSSVTANVTTYAKWNSEYRPEGIFFDESPNDSGNVSYMNTLVTQARSALGSSAPVILNPGVKTDSGYYPFSTLIITAENTYSAFSPSQLTLGSSTPAAKQAVVLHHGPTTTDASLVNALVGTDKIGAIFLTSEEYVSIPRDWTNFVNLVDAST